MPSNQGIPERYVKRLGERIGAAPGVCAVERLEAVYLGPREILVAADVRMDPGLVGSAIALALARVRAEVARDVPAIARLYLTPVA